MFYKLAPLNVKQYFPLHCLFIVVALIFPIPRNGKRDGEDICLRLFIEWLKRLSEKFMNVPQRTLLAGSIKR